MGLFDKKYCDICGEKIGLLGNRKLEDGNCCKDCAKKLSPFMTDRRESTVREIKEHLAYREENRRRLDTVQPTRVIGKGYSVAYICDSTHQFFIAPQSNYLSGNPDLIDISQVVSCDIKVVENRTELTRVDKDGKRVPFNPPRYEFHYQFNVHITVNSPYFNDITFELTPSGNRPENRFSDEFHQYDLMADELRRALLPGAYAAQPAQNLSQVLQQVANAVKTAAQTAPAAEAAPVEEVLPEGSWKCACGGVNTGNFCTNCGSKKPEAPKARFCSNCGWTPGEGNPAPKFCPQCGSKFGE